MANSEKSQLNDFTDQDIEILENLPAESQEDSTALAVIDTEKSRELAIKSLDVEEDALIESIIEAPTKVELEQQFELFNLNQSKKSALRVIKLNNLLSKVEDQAITRFERRPDQISNKELLDYMTTVSSQIDRAQKSIDSVSENKAIQIKAQKNEVNINMAPELDRDSKKRVMDAIAALLAQANKAAPADIIDAEVVYDAEDVQEVNSSET